MNDVLAWISIPVVLWLTVLVCLKAVDWAAGSVYDDRSAAGVATAITVILLTALAAIGYFLWLAERALT